MPLLVSEEKARFPATITLAFSMLEVSVSTAAGWALSFLQEIKPVDRMNTRIISFFTTKGLIEMPGIVYLKVQNTKRK